jgi:condensin complex subunit 1
MGISRERCVPLDRMETVTTATVARLRDKAAQVRKNAIQLLTTMLHYNPYSPQLKLSDFNAKLELIKVTPMGII